MRLTDLDKMDFEFKVEDADLSKLAELFADVNIKETPWFDVSDKHGNSARYYREGQWIPCSERLPEPNEVVLISVNGNVDADWIAVDNTGYGCWYRTMKYAIDIDAWMPLPEPWKGE